MHHFNVVEGGRMKERLLMSWIESASLESFYHGRISEWIDLGKKQGKATSQHEQKVHTRE